MVYEINEAELPPSFAVITAAAVAVGHTRHIIAASSNTFTVTGIVGKKVIDSDITANGNN
jgi:hypothetical protein